MGKDNLSHEEIWDDSALQNSWDDALAEYKKYHSMAAKGEQVDLKELANDAQTESAMNSSTKVKKTSPTNGTPNASIDSPQVAAGADSTSKATSAEQPVPATAPIAPVANSGVPQALLASVQDEGLKNLMMSWYYAGYYTGLLEGQQKAYASMQQADDILSGLPS